MANATINSFFAATLPRTDSWSAVTYGNGLFVAGGILGCATSPDGITWTTRTIPGGGDIRAVTYGNGLFVAVGYFTQNAYTSPDGITWTTRTIPGGTWTAVIYGNALFVAFASNSVCATSPDGITWTTRTIPTGDFRGIAYGNGLFVAVANNANLTITSPDGITWTNRGTFTSSSNYMVALVFANNLFVGAGGAAGAGFYTSPDGITWTVRTISTSNGIFSASTGTSIAYGNGLFIAISQSSIYATSLDGITWKTGSLSSVHNWGPVAYGAGNFVALPTDNASVANYAYVTNLTSAGTTYRYLFTDVVTGATIGVAATRLRSMPVLASKSDTTWA